MIFVIMGMEVHPFDRLARGIDDLAAAGTVGEDFSLQLGACTYEPRHVPFERYLSFGDLCEQIRNASVVITHAGAGSTLVCIQQGKHPIMVPRRASLGEQVDDHQESFAQKLAATGHATAVREIAELPGAIESVRGRAAAGNPLGQARELTDWLEGFWVGLTPRQRRRERRG